MRTAVGTGVSHRAIHLLRVRFDVRKCLFDRVHGNHPRGPDHVERLPEARSVVPARDLAGQALGLPAIDALPVVRNGNEEAGIGGEGKPRLLPHYLLEVVSAVEQG